MATQTFEQRLQKALLDAAKNGANVNYYNFANITGNIYINNGVPNFSSTKPAVAVATESKTETVATKAKKKQDHKTVVTPVVKTVEEPEAFSSDEQIESEDEEIESLNDDDENNSESLSQEIQVTFDEESVNDETHVYNRLREISNDLEGAQKVKLKKKLSKCGDLFKDKFETVLILKVDDQDDFDVCNFKDLQTFKDVVESLSVGL
jgi:outer membrane protein OmpA-like peptidoglycan-associated protein